MYDVITMGAATRDVFLVAKAFMLVPLPELGGSLAECVALGSKIDIDEMVLTSGGGATNAAATFAALGFKTAVVARVGDDEPGRSIITDLEARKIDTSLMKTVRGKQTSYSTLMTAVNGERTALVYRGVSAEFAENDVPWKKLKARWLYITSIGGNLPVLLRAVREAKKENIQVAWNPGDKEIKLGLRSLDAILRHVTVLIVNLEEAQKLTGLQTTDIRALAEQLNRPGLTIVITDSNRGAHAIFEGKVWRSGTRSLRSVSRTGAGDAFGAGVISALMRAETLENALRIGTINAESVISAVGAKTGILKSWPSVKLMNQISVTTT